ncbi:hypothetical protein CYMTET_40345 [Cymbomonas tetramitiformis]|uniref:Uncharacterized protein n=1 Tax=Cymbomonas tetramitiformis TaxID=36881 RepID=A0AAE0CA40_9CHLO|nr:hypothetical protein CYMTET_40345 [Cymbomonas tetramitiformis]
MAVSEMGCATIRSIANDARCHIVSVNSEVSITRSNAWYIQEVYGTDEYAMPQIVYVAWEDIALPVLCLKPTNACAKMASQSQMAINATLMLELLGRARHDFGTSWCLCDERTTVSPDARCSKGVLVGHAQTRMRHNVHSLHSYLDNFESVHGKTFANAQRWQFRYFNTTTTFAITRVTLCGSMFYDRRLKHYAQFKL